MGDLDKLAVKGNFLERLARLERLVERIERREVTAQDMTEITRDLGEVYSGRLAAITAADPTSVEANGAFFDADGVEFSDGQIYHVGGVHNGQLMFGLRADDGAGMFAGGAGVIDSDGMHLTGIRYALEHMASDPDGANARRGAIEMYYPDGTTVPAYRITFGDGEASTELITNGDFGSGTTGWTATLTGGSTFGVADGKAHLYRAPGQSGSVVSSSFVVTPGKHYRAKVGAGGGAADSFGFSAVIQWLNGSSVVIGNSTVLGGKKSNPGGYASVAWSNQNVVVTAPAGAVNARMYLEITMAGTLDFDDVSVQLMSNGTDLVFDDNGFSVLRWGPKRTYGQTHDRNTGSSYLSQIMHLRVVRPMRLSEVHWDLRNSGTYNLRLLWSANANNEIRTLWSGSGVVGVNTITLEKPEVFLPGMYYIGMVRSASATWWDKDAATYREGQEALPGPSDWAYQYEGTTYNTTFSAGFTVPAALKIQTGEYS